MSPSPSPQFPAIAVGPSLPGFVFLNRTCPQALVLGVDSLVLCPAASSWLLIIADSPRLLLSCTRCCARQLQLSRLRPPTPPRLTSCLQSIRGSTPAPTRALSAAAQPAVQHPMEGHGRKCSHRFAQLVLTVQILALNAHCSPSKCALCLHHCTGCW